MKSARTPLVGMTLLLTMAGLVMAQQSVAPKISVDKAITFSHAQLLKTVQRFGDSTLYPRTTGEDGAWKTAQASDWTSGFFPGCLWYASSLTGDTILTRAAARWTKSLTEEQYLTKTHDIGFIMFSCFGRGYQFTENESYKPVLLRAAKSLMTRYNPTVGCIRSWDNRKWAFPVIIDNMMNIELLLWASKHGGTKEMYDAAVSHARMTMKNHFRPDGSTYHVVSYDSANGAVLARETHQGYANESVWARGQAWAIYGFTMAYRETKEPEFLTAAENAANWYLAHLPADNVPFWDFNSPKIPDEKKDASAAAISSSALFELQSFTKSDDLKKRYFDAAVHILESLCSPAYLAEGSTSQGIINHSVGNFPKNSEIDVSLIYTDYYFLEALSRYRSSVETPGKGKRN